jgi:LacI family transcriptional regulator
MRNVTSKDVAKLAGVSRTTVSLILNEAANVRISEETRQRVIKAVNDLKYHPNVLAQSLKTKRSKIIGLIIPSITNPFFPSIAQGVEDAAVENGYNIFLCNSFRDPAKEKSYIETLASKQVDGIIFASITHNSESIRELRQRGVAIIAFDRRISDDDVDTVLFDNTKGGELAVENLLSLGHRRIAFVSGPTNVSSRSDRLEGYKLALTKYGIPVNHSYIIKDDCFEKENLDTNYEVEAGFRMTHELLDRSPEITAIFAVNDMTALGVLKALKARGLTVPDDLSLIGFDDIILAAITDPPLTTIAQPKYKMGRAAMELLISRLDGTKHHNPRQLMLFTPELVKRNSCRKCDDN